MSGDGVTTPAIPVSLGRLTLYFLSLGAIGFGGPIALAGQMQRTLVDERRWFDRKDFLDGLALAQLAPGPLAAQLAMYLGAIHSGFVGATVGGIAFVLPSFAIVWALAAAYVRVGGLPWIAALFYGIGAAVVAVVARAAWKLAALTLRDRVLLWVIWFTTMVVTAWTGREILLLIVAAGLVPIVAVRLRRIRTAALTLSLIPPVLSSKSIQLLLFFAKAGAVVFGSGLAIVPFLYGEVVQHYHWLTDRQFLDAVAVAMITPGPVVITASFIGYVVAGKAGMLAASIGVFLPAYAVVLVVARRFQALASRESVRLFVDGITAAASGAMAGAVLLLARRALVDVPTIVVAAAAVVVSTRWRIADGWLIAAAGAAGLLLRGW